MRTILQDFPLVLGWWMAGGVGASPRIALLHIAKKLYYARKHGVFWRYHWQSKPTPEVPRFGSVRLGDSPVPPKISPSKGKRVEIF